MPNFEDLFLERLANILKPSDIESGLRIIRSIKVFKKMLVEQSEKGSGLWFDYQNQVAELERAELILLRSQADLSRKTKQAKLAGNN